jgi:chitinase
MKSFALSTCTALLLSLCVGACSNSANNYLSNTSNLSPDSHSSANSLPDAETEKTYKVIAYYMGDGSDLARYNINQLTHIIYSFLHLKGNQLSFDSAVDQQALERLVALKQQHPQLKVMLSLGGWGGCETCSDIFNSAENRAAFAQSTLAIIEQYHADGIDLDWEYPTIAGYPGHKYAAYDRANFTALVRELRNAFGNRYELSFAAGGFDSYLENSVDWKAIMPLFDNVNLMSYDIVNGGTPHTGHHTSLYSTPQQKDSTDNAVQFLLRAGVAPEKIVIGTAFYARMWAEVNNDNNGLYQAGKHIEGIDYKHYAERFTEANGYQYFWDDLAKAPTYYNAQQKIFATFDNPQSLAAKAAYVRERQLGGMMFWQLPHDKDDMGLLDSIYKNLTIKAK